MSFAFRSVAALAGSIVLTPCIGLAGDIYYQTNLSSDLPGVAAHQDPNLVNPWGIAFSPTSPIWIADNGTGLSTVYNGAGSALSLVVTIPPPAGGTSPAAPTGIIANGSSDFGGAHFIFSTEDGTIAAWTSGSNAVLEADNSGSGAIYKGLASGFNGGEDLLYATNFNSGTIDVYNSSFGATTVPGGFAFPGLPTGYAPFGIANIGGLLYVTYALQDADKEDDVPGLGNGFVAVFRTDGTLVSSLISQGKLDSPWGLTLAPSDFGVFSGDLLVGNFGNGMINAYDPNTGAFLGAISDSLGNPIVNQGLWGLAFGNGTNGTSTTGLYFTAGIPGPGSVEDHGLFGEIRATPEPGTMVLTGLCAAGLFVFRRVRSKPSRV